MFDYLWFTVGLWLLVGCGGFVLVAAVVCCWLVLFRVVVWCSCFDMLLGFLGACFGVYVCCWLNI